MKALTLVSLILVGALASAQTGKVALNVKLGLWEMTTAGQMSGTPPVDTSKMPPEQAAKMAEAMKAALANAAAPHTSRTCLTREKLDKQLFGGGDTSCTQTVVTNTASVYAIRLVCTGDHPSSGDWRFEALSPESVKGSGAMTIEKSMKSTMTMTAKWIGTDCGDVK